MILHTINKPSALALCEHLIADDDLVILIEEGVYLASGTLPGRCYALEMDVLARGLADSISNTRLIDYDTFVELSTEAAKVCAWF